MSSHDKVLIIEDEKKIADWIKIYLERAGFRTSIASDGWEGLEKTEKINPDLILLDLRFPESGEKKYADESVRK